MDATPLRICVFTAVLGRYERLLEQPMTRQSDMPFICLTDDPGMHSDTWETRVISPLFRMDPIRSQRDLKLRPHVHLPDFDFSVYIDNSVLLTQPPERVFERYFPSSGFCLARHGFRDTVLDEFLAVAKRGLDDQSRIFEQLNHYSLTDPEILEKRLFWGGILLRDHRSQTVRAMLDTWHANVLRYSRLDQLSLNAAFSQVGLTPDIMDIDNHKSWFHIWPRPDYQDTQGGMRSPTASLSPVVARVRQLEQQLVQATRERDELMSSDAWHMGNWVVAKARRHPKLITLLRRGRRLLTQCARPRWPTRRPAHETMSFWTTGQSRGRRRGKHYERQAMAKTIYVDPTDQRGRMLVQSGGNLNPPTVLMWKHLVDSGRWTHILDIGANYGEMLVNVALPRAAKIIAVEPNPRTVPYLKFTLSTAGIDAEVVPAACAEHLGVARLMVDDKWSGKSRLVDGYGNGAEADTTVIDVPTTTIDALLGGPSAGTGIRPLIKIDVEGQELAVLKGGMGSLARLSEFAVLAEALHIGTEEKRWLLDNFAVQIYDMQSDRLTAVSPATAEHLEEMRSDARYYPQEVVLRPLGASIAARF